MSGALQPASSIRRLISGTAAAASGRFTVTRTISEPASASSTHCRAVASASAESVMVIDCTTTGAPPPTCTRATRTPTVRWSRATAMQAPGSRLQAPGRTLLRVLPTVFGEDAADVVGACQGQLHRVVVLGAVHLPVDEPRHRGAV